MVFNFANVNNRDFLFVCLVASSLTYTRSETQNLIIVLVEMKLIAK